MKLRAFQKQVGQVWADVAAGKKKLLDNKLVMDIFPGGGKSLLPVIAAKPLMDAGLIDGVCWVVPRKALQQQGAEDGMSKIAQEIFGGPFPIMEATNQRNPCKDTKGFITTYQALAADISFFCAYELRRKKFLLIPDEFHHLPFGENSTRGDEGKWTIAMRILWNLAAYKMPMTGTSVRHPAQDLIAWMEYDDMPDGSKKPRPDIRYTLNDARQDKAIIDTEFLTYDGKIDYFDKNGDKVSKSSLNNTKDKAEIRCILDTQYQYDLIDKGLESWSSYTHRGGLLIVCRNQASAKMAYDYIVGKGVKRVGLATSSIAEASEQIQRFRNRNLDVLCTCEQAYEGMNAPHADHLVYLHVIRSHPWMTQCLARIMRYDSQSQISYEQQKAWAIMPQDGYTNDFIQWIKGQQENIIEPRQEREGNGIGLGGDIADPYVPINGEATVGRGTLLFGSHATANPIVSLDAEFEKAKSFDIESQRRIAAKMSQAIEEELQLAKANKPAASAGPGPFMTPRQELDRQKEINEKLTRKLDRLCDVKPGTWNLKAKTKFKKSVSDMNTSELKERRKWLLDEGKKELTALKTSQN